MGDGFQPGLTVSSASPLGDLRLWDALPDPVVVARSNGTVVLANAAACSLLGWTAGEVVGQPVDVLVPERLRPLLSWGGGAAWVRRRDGAEVPVALSVSSAGVRDLVVVAMRDERPIERRWQQRRLESLASLAGSVAHEMNNLLAVVLSSAGFLADAVGSDAAAAADVERVRSAAERGARLTRRLLGVGGGEGRPGRASSVSWAEVVGDLAPLVERAGGAELQVRGPAPLPVVLADRRELDHLVLSLVLDSSSGDGVVTVAADLSPPSGMAGVVVRCSPSVLALTTAYAVVARAGGVLEVEEGGSPAASATVRVLLPVGADVVDVSDSTSGVDVAVGDDGAVDRRQVVLVVDDQAALRMLTARLLRRDGFTVLEAGGGHEALRLLEANADSVDVVVSDVVMPQMSGVELCEAVRSVPGGPAVVLMSGYSDAVLGPQGAAAGVPLLRKPFSEEQLLSCVRSALGVRAGEGGSSS